MPGGGLQGDLEAAESVPVRLMPAAMAASPSCKQSVRWPAVTPRRWRPRSTRRWCAECGKPVAGDSFTIHDPTTKDRSGQRCRHAYRFIILTHDAAQAETARAATRTDCGREDLRRKAGHDDPAAGGVLPAEPEHQRLALRAQPLHRLSTQFVVAPKVSEIPQGFLRSLKRSARRIRTPVAVDRRRHFRDDVVDEAGVPRRWRMSKMMAQMANKGGFIAALDQSGGSTPGALAPLRHSGQRL